MVEIQLTFLMIIKVFIRTIVQRFIRSNLKCHQNLETPWYFNVIRPCIYRIHKHYMVLKHFGRDSTVNFLKITVFNVSIAHYGRDSTEIFDENQSFYSYHCSKTN